jgi:hypothetical protein
MSSEEKGLGLNEQISQFVLSCRSNQESLKTVIRPVFGEIMRDLLFGTTSTDPNAKSHGRMLAYTAALHVQIEAQQKQIELLKYQLHALTDIVTGSEQADIVEGDAIGDPADVTSIPNHAKSPRSKTSPPKAKTKGKPGPKAKIVEAPVV